VGPNAQHAFYQLLHQGTQPVMCDFIAPIERDDFDVRSDSHKNESLKDQHRLALANCFAQSRVLMLGDAAIPQALKPSYNTPFKHYAGNQPSNTILLKSISAKTLGMLVALYEHKTFVESVIWEINPFDQWGVELGKLIAKETYQALLDPALAQTFDASTAMLLSKVKSV
jgi:glucose-6-phosphate isomerase